MPKSPRLVKPGDSASALHLPRTFRNPGFLRILIKQDPRIGRNDQSRFRGLVEKNKGYLKWVDMSPEIIHDMGILFEAAYDHPQKKAEYGQQLRAIIPLSGHPTGFYMANLIREQLGKEPLIEKIGNPFAFFRLYKEAADKKGGQTPNFSEKAIRFIQSLENRYIR